MFTADMVLTRIPERYRSYYRKYFKQIKFTHKGRKISILAIIDFGQIGSGWSLLAHWAWLYRMPVYWQDVDSPEISRFLYKKVADSPLRKTDHCIPTNELKPYSPPTDIDRIKLFYS